MTNLNSKSKDGNITTTVKCVVIGVEGYFEFSG